MAENQTALLPCLFCGSPMSMDKFSDGKFIASCGEDRCMACGPVWATPEEATQRWNAVAVRLAAGPSAQTTGPLVVTDPAMVQAIADELGIGHDRAKVTYLLEQMEAHWQASRAAALQYAQELRYADEKRGRV